MQAIKVFPILLFTALATSCERTPRVVVQEGNPPKFFVSAKGILDVFSVSGPVSRCNDLAKDDRAMERYWEIAPLGNFDVSQFTSATPIVYGHVPEGFRQVTPLNGLPPPLCPGAPYAVQLAIRDNGGVNMLFTVQKDGRIVTEADSD
jgi:hypothetical protein